MIETEQQRRWWFSTHPEYSANRRAGRNQTHEGGEDADSVSPEQVDAYVDEKLQHANGPLADLLKSIKRWFGTEGETGVPQEGLTPRQLDEIDYEDGRNDGHRAVREGKAPHDFAADDNSAYARGVRQGVADALDDKEALAQKWLDPLLMLAGTHPSQILGRNLVADGQPRPSADHDRHHLVPWRHWRAQPARAKLIEYGIDINNVENGMWLKRSYHQKLANSYKYMNYVNKVLTEATSRTEALEALARLRDLLSTGNFPL